MATLAILARDFYGFLLFSHNGAVFAGSHRVVQYSPPRHSAGAPVTVRANHGALDFRETLQQFVEMTNLFCPRLPWTPLGRSEFRTVSS